MTLAVWLGFAALAVGVWLTFPPKDQLAASTERFMFGGVAVFGALLTAIVQGLQRPLTSSAALLLAGLFVVAPGLFGAATLARTRLRPRAGSRVFAGAIALGFALFVALGYAVLWLA